jgi:hypothetical protein
MRIGDTNALLKFCICGTMKTSIGSCAHRTHRIAPTGHEAAAERILLELKHVLGNKPSRSPTEQEFGPWSRSRPLPSVTPAKPALAKAGGGVLTLLKSLNLLDSYLRGNDARMGKGSQSGRIHDQDPKRRHKA